MKSFRHIALAGIGLVAMISASPALAGVVFSAPSYTSTFSLNTANIPNRAASTAWDGSSYYVGGGGSASNPIAKYNAAGTQVAGPVTPTPGIDFRSLFSDASGALYARGFASNIVYKQTTFGNFTPFVTLSGTLDNQEQVVLDAGGTRYIGNNNGVVQIWNLAGALTGTVTLAGVPTSAYPQNRGISVFGNYWLNYNGGTLSAYDRTTGALVDQTILVGAGNGFNENFGQSFANGYFFVPTDDSSVDRGYRIAAAIGAVPEPTSWALMLIGFGAVGATMRLRKSARLQLA